MNFINYHKGIRSLHRRVNRIQKYIDKHIPGEDRLLPLFVNLVHGDIERMSRNSTIKIEDVRQNLDRCYYNIVKAIKELNLDDSDIITSDIALCVSIKYDLWRLIRTKVKGHKIEKGKFRDTMKRFAKEK